MKDKTLFLWLNCNDFYPINAKRRGVNVAQVYKNSPLILRMIRRLQIKLKLPLISLWIENWKYNIDSYETVIIHASKITVPVVKFIKKRNPDIRIILWYWNPVDKMVSLKHFDNNICEIWSFDEYDCEKYDLHYNVQYYFNDLELPNSNIENDIFFVGGDKGRLKSLLEIQKDFQKYGLSTYFHITDTHNQEKTENYTFKSPIAYTEILDYISKSTAILDYVSENQSGLTLRPLESLFFNKKLITNDQSIINRDFYNKDNIFILGKDNMDNLPHFLNSPIVNISEDIKNRYDFDDWFNNFFKLLEGQ